MDSNKNSLSKIQEYKEGYLYHGSSQANLKEIKPRESGHGDNYVYATSDIAFATMFSAGRGNTLVAMWKKNEQGVPLLCERVEGIFDNLYKGRSSSIYVLNSENFFRKKGMWANEYVSKEVEGVVSEIKIDDVREFLLELRNNNEFQLVEYKDRKKHFPNIEKEEIEDVRALIDKYGEEDINKLVEKWRPDLLDKIGWSEVGEETNSEFKEEKTSLSNS